MTKLPVDILRDLFFNVAQTYGASVDRVERCWDELIKHYTHKKRHYHNLIHINELINELKPLKPTINDWTTLMMSVFYHDVIYKVTKRDNEEKSAVLAQQRLTELNFTREIAEKCHDQIIATKTHQMTGDCDTDMFTDADLAILGRDLAVYKEYCKQIRNEYSIYPDLMYNPARKKALLHFLEMDRIYTTDFFYARYENQARKNLHHEISTL